MTPRTPTPHSASAAYRHRAAHRAARWARAPRLSGSGYAPALPAVLDRARVADAPQGVVSPAEYRAADLASAADCLPNHSPGAAGPSAAPRRQDLVSAPYRTPTGSARALRTGAGSTVTGSTGRGLKSAPRSRPVGSVGAGDRAPCTPLRNPRRRDLEPCADRRELKRRRWTAAQNGGRAPVINPERHAQRRERRGFRAALHTLSLSIGQPRETAAAGLTRQEDKRRSRRLSTTVYTVRYLTRMAPGLPWRALRALRPACR